MLKNSFCCECTSLYRTISASFRLLIPTSLYYVQIVAFIFFLHWAKMHL